MVRRRPDRVIGVNGRQASVGARRSTGVVRGSERPRPATELRVGWAPRAGVIAMDSRPDTTAAAVTRASGAIGTSDAGIHPLGRASRDEAS